MFDAREFRLQLTSKVWSRILTQSGRDRLQLLIISGAEHLGGVGEGRLSSTEIRDMLKSFLLHGTPFMCTRPERGARFLLEDEQLWGRYRGSVSRADGCRT
jgi:hypothetical protein